MRNEIEKNLKLTTNPSVIGKNPSAHPRGDTPCNTTSAATTFCGSRFGDHQGDLTHRPHCGASCESSAPLGAPTPRRYPISSRRWAPWSFQARDRRTGQRTDLEPALAGAGSTESAEPVRSRLGSAHRSVPCQTLPPRGKGLSHCADCRRDPRGTPRRSRADLVASASPPVRVDVDHEFRGCMREGALRFRGVDLPNVLLPPVGATGQGVER